MKIYDNYMSYMYIKPVSKYVGDYAAKKLIKTFFFIPNLLYSIGVYCRNRFISKIHVLETGFEKGRFYDLDNRILYACFNSLVDYIEIEKASSYNQRSDNGIVYKWVNGRCKEAGLAHLEWEIELPSNSEPECLESSIPQADMASKQLNLYNWWLSNKDDFDLMDSHSDLYQEGTLKLVELIQLRASLWT